MGEKRRIVLWLQHMRGGLWHRYSVAVKYWSFEVMISTKILGTIPLLEATLSHGHCNGTPHSMEYHCRSDDFN